MGWLENEIMARIQAPTTEAHQLRCNIPAAQVPNIVAYANTPCERLCIGTSPNHGRALTATEQELGGGSSVPVITSANDQKLNKNCNVGGVADFPEPYPG
jgi:hypothetical protein